MDNLKYSREFALVSPVENKIENTKIRNMGKLLQLLIIGYFISVALFGAYYNYLYAVENGFLAWLFFGEVIASLKALVWPLFEFKLI